jgi:hypothetical protein
MISPQYTPSLSPSNSWKRRTSAIPSPRLSPAPPISLAFRLLTWRYTQKCSNLLTQYKAILKDEEVLERFGDLESFQRKYNVSFTSATYRLKVGVPATVEHAGSHHISSSSDTVTDQVNAQHIAETVEVRNTPSPLSCFWLTWGRNSSRLWTL